ncbi:class-II fumarase/aspartase family protein [Tritonibacter scottomollicae]|uniref:3-carboxy-cis,cis-muconate cycloisomerase n=1 Tax=Tritonibacter scottomollicae TaxID=483013 RepID=A0A2T1A5H8_TRISK|nr:adenylosuccinate lyase family protein [Tritonibacter scottomollicae]PRZ43865.1 3-carboxy-cis,cis-muconate cycloisomerase [Tritonibacter scottomollicae]
MPASLFDSPYYADQFSTPAMRALFSDEGRFQSWLDFEAALARAEAGCGVIPRSAAEAITEAATLDSLDPMAMREVYGQVGFAIVPLVKQLTAACPEHAARYVHWGATTQDVLDTGLVLQIRAGLEMIETELDGVIAALVSLARTHRDTPQAGRTFQQHAAPITFGYKVAGWLDEALRHRARLPGVKARALAVQYGGAVGTLAPLREKGTEVRAALARELELRDPDITWHTGRDSLAEVIFWLGLVGGLLGRIGTEIAMLMRSEVSEVREPYVPGRGASSAMPQKRNPIACPQIIAIANRLRALVPQMMESQIQEHERGIAAMPVEWMVIPEAFLLASGALMHARPVLEGLDVDTKNMRRTLHSGGGLIMSEAVMSGLAPRLGRSTAHEVVTTAAAAAMDSGRHLRDTLLENESVLAEFNPAAIDQLLDPGSYTGSCGAMVDAVLARAKQQGFE